MPEMSKLEMLIRVAAAAHHGSKLQILTSTGIIECETSKLVTQESMDNGESCTPLQIALSIEEEPDVQKEFDDFKGQRCEFVLLKNAVIYYSSGAVFSVKDLVIFLDSIDGFSLGHLGQSAPKNC